MPDTTPNYAIKWDQTGERYYENGVSHGVLFPMKDDGTYDSGVAWNGLTNVTNSPEGAEPNELWADNMKYGVLRSAETFSGSIEAYMYPDEFKPCIGQAQAAEGVYFGEQAHKKFGFCYRTEIGSDSNPEAGYKIHLVYGASVTPSEESYDTINDSPDAITFSWDFDTEPVSISSYKPMSHVVIDSRYADETKLTAFLQTLYGTPGSGKDGNATAAIPAKLPLPDAVKTAFS